MFLPFEFIIHSLQQDHLYSGSACSNKLMPKKRLPTTTVAVAKMKSTSLIVHVFFILLPASSAFMPSSNCLQLNGLISSSNAKACKELHLYRSAQEAIADAERICNEEGLHSERCKVAWDIVEELEAADAHVRSPSTGPNELSYSPLVNSLEILSTKIERKMDELKNLSTQLAEAGAGPEVERLIYASDEMKQIIAEARAATDQYR